MSHAFPRCICHDFRALGYFRIVQRYEPTHAGLATLELRFIVLKNPFDLVMKVSHSRINWHW